MLRICSATASSFARAIGTNSEGGCSSRHFCIEPLLGLGSIRLSMANSFQASFLRLPANSKTVAASSLSKFFSFMAEAFAGLLRNTHFGEEVSAAHLSAALIARVRTHGAHHPIPPKAA